MYSLKIWFAEWHTLSSQLWRYLTMWTKVKSSFNGQLSKSPWIGVQLKLNVDISSTFLLDEFQFVSPAGVHSTVLWHLEYLQMDSQSLSGLSCFRLSESEYTELLNHSFVIPLLYATDVSYWEFSKPKPTDFGRLNTFSIEQRILTFKASVKDLLHCASHV